MPPTTTTRTTSTTLHRDASRNLFKHGFLFHCTCTRTNSPPLYATKNDIGHVRHVTQQIESCTRVETWAHTIKLKNWRVAQNKHNIPTKQKRLLIIINHMAFGLNSEFHPRLFFCVAQSRMRICKVNQMYGICFEFAFKAKVIFSKPLNRIV